MFDHQTIVGLILIAFAVLAAPLVLGGISYRRKTAKRLAEDPELDRVMRIKDRTRTSYRRCWWRR